MKRWLGLLGFCISAFFMYLAFRNIQLGEVISSLKEAKYPFLLPALLFIIIGWVLASVKWKLILDKEEVTFGSVFSAYTIGLMANNILPVRSGELIKAYLLGRKEELSKSQCFGTVVIDKMMDFSVLFGFLLSGFLLPSISGWLHKSILWGGLALLLMVIGAGILSVKSFPNNLAQRLNPIISPKLQEAFIGRLRDFGMGLRRLKRVSFAFKVFLLSCLVWGSMSFGLYFALQALTIEIPFWGIFFMTGIVNLGALIPSSPGYLGNYQFLAIAGLSAFAIQKSEALSFSFIYHALWYVPYTVTGLYFFMKENIRLTQLTDLKGSEKLL